MAPHDTVSSYHIKNDTHLFYPPMESTRSVWMQSKACSTSWVARRILLWCTDDSDLELVIHAFEDALEAGTNLLCTITHYWAQGCTHNLFCDQHVHNITHL